ncbi:hypothetical protein DFO55_12489 [Grimontella sp. AG753]|nr:hypothetical protein DFO55_12489 [Grimontella sp. AG753]
MNVDKRHYNQTVLPILSETKFINATDKCFSNPSKALKLLDERVKIHVPGGLKELLVPALTEKQMLDLVHSELHLMCLHASYLLSTGYWKYFHYSENYLESFRKALIKKQTQIANNGYVEVNNEGEVIERHTPSFYSRHK